MSKATFYFCLTALLILGVLFTGSLIVSVVVNEFNQEEGVIDTTINGVPSQQTSYVTLPNGVKEKVVVTYLNDEVYSNG